MFLQARNVFDATKSSTATLVPCSSALCMTCNTCFCFPGHNCGYFVIYSDRSNTTVFLVSDVIKSVANFSATILFGYDIKINIFFFWLNTLLIPNVYSSSTFDP